MSIDRRQQSATSVKRCARGHKVSFSESEPGLVTCTCNRCAKKTGSIYRGHALNKYDAYLRYLLAVASW